MAVQLLLLCLAIGCTLDRGHLKHQAKKAPASTQIEGRVVLPPGDGPRGVEVQAHAGESVTWARLDAHGHFTVEPPSWPVHIAVVAASTEVAGVDIERGGKVEIDARSAVRSHRLKLVAKTGQAQGGVRIGVWTGEVPRGPMGSLPSLGSAQFPDRVLPSDTEWLLPVKAPSVTFLVERPADHQRGRNWKSGAQQVFGPFALDELPEVLEIE